MTDNIKWPVVEVTVETDAAEAVVFALTESGAAGTSYSLLNRPETPNVTVRGFFDSVPEMQEITRKLREALDIYGFDLKSMLDISVDHVEDQDWLAEWKKHWKPTVTDRFIVAAPWQEIEPEDRILIRIEPKMAFGTGTHETTRLCLKALEELYTPGQSLLDVGTGTGILAIAAAKLSGDAECRIDACDIDPEAVSAAIENSDLNGCPFITVSEGTIESSSPDYDIVCANLTTDTILPLLQKLLEKAGTALIMSGILEEKALVVTEALAREGYTDADVRKDGEWVSVVVRKSD